MGADVHPLQQDVVATSARCYGCLWGRSGSCLLIACANVANLFLVRRKPGSRSSPCGRRWGPAGGAWRVDAAESITLAIAGGALGIGPAYAGLRLLVALAPGTCRAWRSASAPDRWCLRSWSRLPPGRCSARFRRSSWHISLGAGAEGRAGAERRQGRRRARNVLAVAQIALALVLLVSAGLMLRTFQALRHIDTGFTRPSELLTFRIPTPMPKGVTADQIVRTHQRILERIRQLPGVTHAAAASEMNLQGQRRASIRFWWRSFRPRRASCRPCVVPVRLAGYFPAAGNRIGGARHHVAGDRAEADGRAGVGELRAAVLEEPGRGAGQTHPQFTASGLAGDRGSGGWGACQRHRQAKTPDRVLADDQRIHVGRRVPRHPRLVHLRGAQLAGGNAVPACGSAPPGGAGGGCDAAGDGGEHHAECDRPLDGTDLVHHDHAGNRERDGATAGAGGDLCP